MTPDQELSSGPAAATLSGSAISTTFHPVKAGIFFVSFLFSSDAVGTVSLVRTLDQGATWTPRMAGPNVISNFDAQSGTVDDQGRHSTWEEVVDYDSGIYRLQANLTAGSVVFKASALPFVLPTSYPAPLLRRGLIGADGTECMALPPDATAAQRAALITSLWTPLNDADISGTLTGYKYLERNQFAKISVPAAAQRWTATPLYPGRARLLYAEYVDVLSLFDERGKAVAADLARPWLNGQDLTFNNMIYTPGQRVMASDQTPSSSQYFSDPRAPKGIQFHLTMAEALSTIWRRMLSLGFMGITPYPSPDLTALGI